MIDQTDVVVVGAGLAGLQAAHVLAGQGVAVAVLEARDRVGGRTWSDGVPGLPGSVVDRGGQWIGPGQRRLERLAAELQVATFPTYHAGKKVLDVCGKISTYKRSIPSLPLTSLLELELSIRRLTRLSARVSPADPLAAADAVALDGASLEDWTRRTVHSKKVRACFDVAVRTVFGAEPRDLSMLYFLAYLRAGEGLMHLVEIEGGAQERRFVGGAQSLAKGLAAKLGDRVVLSAPVRAITQSPGGVVVRSDAGAVQCKRAIVAVPPALAGRIDYQPLLPVQRDQLTQRFPMGATAKVHAVYPHAFWRDMGFSGEAVADRGPASVVFDNTGKDGEHPALLGFIVGQEAREWSARDPGARRDAYLAQLARYFGDDAQRPVGFVDQDWSTEAWTRGCPTGVLPPGGMTAAGRALRTPCGRVHWAGTETAVAYTGYMEGALESGERAAAEVTRGL